MKDSTKAIGVQQAIILREVAKALRKSNWSDYYCLMRDATPSGQSVSVSGIVVRQFGRAWLSIHVVDDTGTSAPYYIENCDLALDAIVAVLQGILQSKGASEFRDLASEAGETCDEL